jgi:hypothetical protein
MLTFKEIKTRKEKGKRKWGYSLIVLLKDHFDDNFPLEALCDYLFENHQIEITPDGLAHIKARHYPKIKDLITQSSKNISTPNAVISSENKIVQKVVSEMAETLYQKMYQPKNSCNEFDLGRDF